MKNKILNLDSIPEEFMYKELGCGCNADCYLTKFGVVFKMMFYPEMEDYNTILKNSEYSSEVIIFPKLIVHLKHKFIGYLMEYADGNNLKDISDKVNIIKYIKAIKRLEEEIYKFSNYKIKFVDIGYTNIIYTKDDKMKAIDTDFYEHDSNDESLLLNNLYSLSESVIKPFIDSNLRMMVSYT